MKSPLARIPPEDGLPDYRDAHHFFGEIWVKWSVLVVGSLFALGGCSGGKGSDTPGDHHNGTTTNNNTNNTPSDSGTGSSSGSSSSISTSEPLDVAAIGFQYIGIYDQYAQTNNGFISPNSSGSLSFLPNYYVVTLADAKYFGTSTPDPVDFCTFLALFDGTPSQSLQGTAFDWDAGKGSTGDILPTFGMFEGKLTIIPDSLDDRCSQLDPSVFPGGDPTELMDGMHFGVGFGPLSPALQSQFGTATTGATTWPVLQNALLTTFIAINHPDGSGGVTFPAYDWDSGFYAQTDFTVCATFYASTTTAGLYECGEPELDETATSYIPGDITVQPLKGYIQSNARWFEDVPNLDLTLLKDGA